MSKNRLRYQDLGAGPATDLLPVQEPFLESISEGQATSVNDLPTVVGITENQDYLIVYIPGTGHRKILISDIGEFFPAGGTTGQLLLKNSNTDFDVSWVDVPVGGLVDTGNTVTLSGDITGNGSFDVNGDAAIGTAIALPNVVLMDGGGAGSTYPQEAQGPYGVVDELPAGGLTGEVLGKLSNTEQDADWIPKADPIIVQNNNDIITSDLKKLIFSGPGYELLDQGSGVVQVNIFGANQQEDEFCPGYEYNYINGTSWQIVGLDRAQLFSVGRRLHFTDGSIHTYGVIATSTFTGGNTVLTMTMENGATLVEGIERV